jgi:DNA repair exonuclease SbcCD ATPase subunit
LRWQSDVDDIVQDVFVHALKICHALTVAAVCKLARQSAIAQEIAKIQAKMEEQTASDETIKNLEHLLELRTARLEDLKKMHDAGVVQTTDVQTAEADLLSAKIELDKTRAALKRANGGEQLDTWNNELSHIAIDRAETEARLKFLGDVSANTEGELSTRREAEKLAEEAQPKLAQAEKTISELSEQLEQIKQEQENIEPLRVMLPDEPNDTATDSTPDAAPNKSDASPNKNAK